MRPEATKTAATGVTGRAVVTGVFFAAFFCAVTPYNDFKIAATFLSGTYFPISALFVLLLFVGGVNVVLRRLRPAAEFTRGELLTIWTLILVASGLPSSGMMRLFIPHIVAPHYYSNAVNQWEYKVWGRLPDWLKIRDQAAADAFFRGYRHGEERIPWEAWIQPLLVWGLLALLFLGASFCVASLLRRQWVENEKFSFPLVVLPLLLTEEPPPGRLVNDLLRNRLLWLAVGFTTVLHSSNGLHRLYPALPALATTVDLMPLFASPPWNQIGPLQAWFYPLVIGLSYLLPTEVCFSLWFFHFFYKAQVGMGTYYNWDMPATFLASGSKLFHGLEVLGGALALVMGTLWSARRHLRDVWEKAVGGPRAHEIDDRNELLSHRASLLGLAVCYAGIGVWLYLATVPVSLILLALLMTTLTLIVVSWMVCQAGMLFTAIPFGTLDFVGATLNTAHFDIPALYMTGRYETMFLYPSREMLLPSLLNGAKGAEGARLPARRLFGAMALSVGIGLVVSCVASLWLPYYNGGANALPDNFTYRGSPQRPLLLLGGIASAPPVGSWVNNLHIAGGFVGVLGLLLLRARVGWGLHPIGFLTAAIYALQMLWFSLLLGWLFKTLIQRYGGHKGYVALLPFFLGLIIGDVLNAVVWVIVGGVTGIGYRLTPP